MSRGTSSPKDWANLAGGVSQALPTGGSLSRAGVATSAGARTRWSNVFAGLWLTLIVVLVGKQAELVGVARVCRLRSIY